MAGVDYSRPLRPKWSGTAGINFQVPYSHHCISTLHLALSCNPLEERSCGGDTERDFCKKNRPALTNAPRRSPWQATSTANTRLLPLYLICVDRLFYFTLRGCLVLQIGIILEFTPVAVCIHTFIALAQRAGARDDHGQPKVVDFYGGPLTFRYAHVS